jgi:hypothetical protein
MDPYSDPQFAPANRSGSRQPVACPDGFWSVDLRVGARREINWLWQGYLAAGSITLWTSRWKAGKTTLLSVLLSRRVAGGQLAGRAVAPGRTALVSEESRELWELRRERLDFGNHTWFLCRPFSGKPSFAQWSALIDRLGQLKAASGVDLAVIDSLSHFLPGGGENLAPWMLEMLAPLRRLTERRMAVLLLHHPKKGAAAQGEAARGSGALAAYADIIVEMDCCRRARAGNDRRRALAAYSRYDETPRELVVELNAEGTDYAALGDLAQDEFRENWSRLRAALAGAPGKLTRREVAERWPDDGPPPSETSVRRWLKEALARGQLRCEGAGTRESPRRYWLPEMEAKWMADPLYRMIEEGRRVQEQLARLGPAEPL